jgi:hypothetical protein
MPKCFPTLGDLSPRLFPLGSAYGRSGPRKECWRRTGRGAIIIRPGQCTDTGEPGGRLAVMKERDTMRAHMLPVYLSWGSSSAF